MTNQGTSNEAAERLEQRSLGILPHINIAGTDFTVDWRLKELRETVAPWNSISMRQMEMDESGKAYLCFYDTKLRNLWRFNPHLTALPENVVLLEIPYEIKLDSYAVAQEHGIDPAGFIKYFAIEKELSAVVKSLSESGLPQLIAENAQKLQAQTNWENDQSPERKRGR